MTRSVWIGAACAVLAGVLALPPVLGRVRAEERNKAVDILIEFPEARALAAGTGRSIEEVLTELKTAGATGVVVYEDTVDDWVRSGRLVGAPAADKPLPRPAAADWMVDPSGMDRLKASVTGKFGWTLNYSGSEEFRVRGGGEMVRLPHNLNALGTAGLGVDPSSVDLVRRVGLRPVARVANYPGASERGIEWTLRDAKQNGCEVAVFLGNEVLGAREMIPTTAAALRETDLIYAYIEFGKQSGDAKLLKEMVAPAEPSTRVGKVLRLHSVLPAEMFAMTPEAVIERYVRAARERGCKMLYFRMISLAGEDPVRSNADYLRRIVSGLRRVGMDVKPARPMEPLPDSPMRTAVAIVAPFLAAIALLATLRWPLWLALAAPLPGIVADLVGVGPEHAVHALLVALLFPTALTLVAYEAAARLKPLGAVAAFFAVSLLGVFAALSVAGMLSTLPYMMKATSFMGVKLAHVVPVLAVGGVLTLRAYRDQTFGYPVRWWQLGLVLVGMVLLALLVVRTGNEAASVSGAEMGMRSLLDRILPIRPRTKEVFFGHPLLVAAMIALACQRTRFLPLLFACGAVGQASVLNTFCHIHTPLSVSLTRALWGIGLGGILGIAAYVVAVPVGLWIGRVWNLSWSSRGTSAAAT
ncbi:MAG: hypothetical protein HRF45_00555 [Fimbriimonadia bacterium]|jgi:hypothetical protein